MTKTVAYIRVSSDKQVEHGISLEAQESKIRAMAVVLGVEISEVIVDAGESAKSLQRPGMLRLLQMVDRGEVERVIVAKLDRATRSVRDLGELLERFARHDVALVSVCESLDTKTAAGKLVLNLLTSVSEWERQTIAERTRDALRHKKATGKVYSRPVFGFDVSDGRMVPNATEQGVIDRMRALRADGNSYASIAEVLNSEGVACKRGGRWASQTVCDILAAQQPAAMAATAA